MADLINVFRHLCIACIAAGGILILSAQTSPAHEYQLKAVFLFNFSQFTEWPARTFSSPNAPLVIGVLGDDPFGSTLNMVIKEEKVNDHPLIIRHFKSIKEITDCHILFINYRQEEQLQQAFKALNGKSILTVGDAPGFIKYGGMVRFINENDKIRFQINPDKARQSDLQLSSKLLRLAEIVNTKTEVQ
jgi:hypothetical protein